MPLIDVTDFRYPDGWAETVDAQGRAVDYCRGLERGGILFFGAAPFDFPGDEIEFLLSQKQSSFKGHKNISYRAAEDVLRGDSDQTPESRQRLRQIMRNHSTRVSDFLGKFLIPYAGKWKLDYASFRPLEEQNRDLPVHKRNDLLHVDAFPSRPTRGWRILRVFTNIHPERKRVWKVTEPFGAIARKYARDAGLEKLTTTTRTRRVMDSLAPVLRRMGIRTADRSRYDRFMLRFHNYLKENTEYQANYPQEQIEFPPGSTWLVYTDTVPHAVVSGQYALEQTYIVSPAAMIEPQSAPIGVLEELAGCKCA